MSVDWKGHMRGLIETVGVTARWTPASGAPAQDITGSYRNPFREIDLGEAGFAASKPVFECMSADVDGIRRGDALEIDATCFKVASAPEHNPVSGVVRLVLETV